MPQKSNPLKFAFSIVITIILTLGFSISLQSLLAAWTAPSTNPPDNNIINFLVSGNIATGGDAGVYGNLFASGTKMALYANTTTGNVGIGTTNPGYRLDIDASGTSGLRIINAELSGSTELRLGAAWGRRGLYSAGDMNILATNGLALSGRGNSTDLYVNNSGNIGIGMSAPTAKLEVSGDVKITGGGILNSAGKQIIQTNATDWTRWNQGSGATNGNAMYQSLALGSGGLSVGAWSNQPLGDIYATGKVKSNNYCDAAGNNCKAITSMGGVSQEYVDSKIGGGTSLNGFVEVPYNLNEDIYGAETNSSLSSGETCGSDVNVRFYCGASDEKICIDIFCDNRYTDEYGQSHYSCGGVFSLFKRRSVICKKGVLLQKISGNFTKNINYTELWNLYGREMYGSG